MGKITIKKLDKIKLLKVINILLLLVLVVTYLSRFVYFYFQEHKIITNQGEKTTLKEQLLKHESTINKDLGLVKDGDSYYYKGDVDGNYIIYSNRLYRILGINESGNVRVVSENIDTNMISGLEKGYKSSYVKNWLNPVEKVSNSGIYLASLYNYEKTLVKSSACLDDIVDIDVITCKEVYKEDYVTLLSLYDYMKAGYDKSFLVKNNFAFLSTDGSSYYVANSDGKLSLDNISYKPVNIRPVLTLNGSIKGFAGSGTQSDPYVVASNTPQTVKDLVAGSYVIFDEYTFRMISNDSNGVKVALDGYVLSDKDEVVKKYGSTNSEYSLSKNGLGYYLNNDFYNSLKHKQYLVKGPWYVGKMKLSNLDYRAIYGKKVNAYVGLLGLGDLFVNDYIDAWTLTRSYDSNNLVYVVQPKGIMYADIVTNKHKIRPAVYLNSSLKIVGGSGIKDSPYVLSEE